MMKITRLFLKNFRSYGNTPTEIKFSDNNEIVGVIGRNGNGKSSAFSIAPHFAIFGDSPKGKIEDLINWDTKKNLLVEMDIYDDKQKCTYTIKRGLKPNKNELYKNGELVENKSLINKKDFDDYIINLLQVDKVFFQKFINNNIKKSMDFLSSSRGDKMKIFNYIFDLENIQKMKDFMKVKRKEKSEYLSENEIKLDKLDVEFEAHKQNIIQYENDIKNNSDELKIIKQKKSEEDKGVNNKKKSIREIIKNILFNIRDVKTNIEGLKEPGEGKINPLKESLENLGIDKKRLELSRLTMESKNIHHEIENIDLNIKSYELKNKSLNEKNKLLDEKIKSLNENPNKCPVCGNSMDDEHYKKELKRVSGEIKEIDLEINNNLKTLKEMGNKKEEFKKNLLKKKEDIILIEKGIETEEKNEKSIKEKIQKIQSKIDEYNDKKIELKSEYQKLKGILGIEWNKYNNLKISKGEYDKAIETQSNLIKSMKSKLITMKKDQKIRADNYNTIADEVDKYSAEVDYLTFLIDTVMDNTQIVKYIVESNLRIIEKLVNVFLKRFQFPHSLELQFNQDLELIFSSGKPFEVLSDGEELRVKFSFAFAFIHFLKELHKNNLNILVLDEMISSSADDVMIDETFKILYELKKDMTVIVITHDDRVKDRFDKVFETNKGLFSGMEVV